MAATTPQPRARTSGSGRTVLSRRTALTLVKAVHTAIWFAVEANVVYLLYAGAADRSDRRAAVAAGIVGTECAIFLANGARCPLTAVAESLGAEHGSVTDIYLPGWLARSLPVIHIPLVALAAGLHWRNLQTMLRVSTERPPGAGRMGRWAPIRRVGP
jgi:hypothetical protein